MASVIVTGNLLDGFQVFGPFDTPEEAIRFTDQIDGIEVQVIPVHDPIMLTDAEGEG